MQLCSTYMNSSHIYFQYRWRCHRPHIYLCVSPYLCLGVRFHPNSYTGHTMPLGKGAAIRKGKKIDSNYCFDYYSYTSHSFRFGIERLREKKNSGLFVSDFKSPCLNLFYFDHWINVSYKSHNHKMKLWQSKIWNMRKGSSCFLSTATPCP